MQGFQLAKSVGVSFFYRQLSLSRTRLRESGTEHPTFLIEDRIPGLRKRTGHCAQEKLSCYFEKLRIEVHLELSYGRYVRRIERFPEKKWLVKRRHLSVTCVIMNRGFCSHAAGFIQMLNIMGIFIANCDSSPFSESIKGWTLRTSHQSIQSKSASTSLFHSHSTTALLDHAFRKISCRILLPQHRRGSGRTRHH